jgi:hypothetical protein
MKSKGKREPESIIPEINKENPPQIHRRREVQNSP